MTQIDYKLAIQNIVWIKYLAIWRIHTRNSFECKYFIQKSGINPK